VCKKKTGNNNNSFFTQAHSELAVKSWCQKIKRQSVRNYHYFFPRENLINKNKMKTEPKAITSQNAEIL